MKRHLFHFLLLSAVVLTGGALVGCGDEVQELANNADNEEAITETSVGANCTLFSSGDEGTRTWMDTGRKFYWSEGNQIYVNTSGTNYKKTSKSTLLGDGHRADFVLEGVSLTAEKCSVVYIGNGMLSTTTTATATNLRVKIEKEQTQVAWGDSKHLGASGDCGVAEAEKDAVGKYTFDIRHKAAYLIFQPYKDAQITANWKLIKIEIIADGTNLAGVYDFGTGELVGAGSYNTVALNCNSTLIKNSTSSVYNFIGVATGGFDLNHTAASAANSCFAVIAPGDHKLTIRYTVQPEGSVEDVAGAVFIIDKEIPAVNADGSRTYNPNGVTTIKHKLDVMLFNPTRHYQWGAADEYLNTWQTEAYNKTTVYDNLTMTTPVNWASLPSANEAAWYVLRGDPHWDGIAAWSQDGGLNVYFAGLWLLKREHITGFDPAKDPNNKDLLASYMVYYNPTNTIGKPANTTNYFFLPAQRYYDYGSLSDPANDKGAVYWTRSALSSYDAYAIAFYDAQSYMTPYRRSGGYPVQPDWFQ